MPELSIMVKPVSSACNMRCKYCFYSDVSENRQQAYMGRMSSETLENLVRRAMRYANGTVSFAFQGGEPSLAGAEFYRELVRLQRLYNSRGLIVQNSIQSNGYDISDELLDVLEQEHFLVGISLDGSERIHDSLRVDAHGKGSYTAVMKTIGKLRERNIDFNILCVVTEDIAQKPREVFNALAEYGYIQFIPCLDPFDASKHDYSLSEADYTRFLIETFRLYYEAYKERRPVSVRNFDNYVGILLGRTPENCGMTGRCAQYYLIEADGSVYPCDFYVLDRWNMGNINDSSFFSMAKSPVAEEFLKCSLHVDEKCTHCKWYRLCRGGCRRDREPFLDGVPGRNKWCGAYEAFFESSYDKLVEIAEDIRSGGNM